MKTITVRRSLEQVKHCVEEALSVWENEESTECAYEDAEQAYVLLRDVILPKLKAAKA